MLKYFVIFYFLFYQIANSQSGKIKIQYINIHDKNLFILIKKYIIMNNNNNKLFRDGIGFVTITNFESNLSNGKPMNLPNYKPTQKNITINIKAFPLLINNKGTCIICNNYPTYYTIIENKIVLIYDEYLFNLFGRNSTNQLDNRYIFKNSSLKKISNLIYRKSLKQLPDNFLFDDFIEPKISFIELKNKSKKNSDVYNYYEFINFNALRLITYSSESNTWQIEK